VRRFVGTASAVLCLLWGSLTVRGDQLPDTLPPTLQSVSSVVAPERGGDVRLAGGQSQTSIAVDSTGQHIVIGFNDTRGFDSNPVRLSGFMYSDDGGATFTDGGQLPSPATGSIPNLATRGTTLYPQLFGDPEVKYLGGSNFVYFSLMLKEFGPKASGLAQTICVHRSTDYGHTWEGPFEVTAATNPNGLSFFGGSAADSADKEFADVDPKTGRVLMAWSNFTQDRVEILSTYSDNILTGTPTWSPRAIVSAASFEGQAPIPRFAAGSNDVYVAWQRSSGTWKNDVGFARSTDNGATFSAPVTLAPAPYLTMDQVVGTDRVNNFPSIAVDNSTGPFRGNVYVVYTSNDGHDGGDVMFQRSADRGLTFSAPIALNSRPAGDRAQWCPWVTVDTTNGRVYAFYYDQGIAASGDLTETSVQYSDDGGAMWTRPMPLSARPFHAGHGNDAGQPNLSEYNQAVAQNGELFAAFAATTQPGFTDGLPLSSVMTTPDVVFKRTTPFKVSLSLGAPTFTDSGRNGAIDRGERISLSIPLANYVTNPLSAGSVGAISATLSTPTIGVSIRRGTSAYPDAAPGATVVNRPAFVVDIGASFAAGSHIEFALHVVTDQGSTTLRFTQATGSPIATTLLAENFDGVALGALPPRWLSSHVAGANIVAWRTNNTFMGTGSNAAFHANANDGVGNHSRWERLLSPTFDVPANAEYVTVEFDVEYDTEDEPTMNTWAYDGLLLRIADLGPASPVAFPVAFRSVLAEAFAEEFKTGALDHYPKHLPRNSNPSYLEDMSVWAGKSPGVQHVRMKLPGMAGRRAQLRFEYTQDSLGTCADVRPASRCGVGIDNVTITSVVSARIAATQTRVLSSQNPSDSGEPVTFTASVKSGGDTVTAGTVTFSDGSTSLTGPLPLDGSGRATFTTSDLTVGSHTIAADYSGDGDLQASSGSVAQTVDPLPTISIADVSVAEGNSGASAAVFSVTLSAATHSATAKVDFVTADGTASAGSDYVATNGTVSFAPGETIQVIAVPINGDNVYEPDELFVLNLSNASNATIANGRGSATILNDDPLPAIAINDVSVTEGNTGTTPAVFTVSLSNPSSAPVSVNFATADGTALAASDYAAASGSISFAPLETMKTITVSARGDFVIERDETFSVTLTNASGATIGDGEGVGTIRNDDTVATTLAALIDQVTRAPWFDDQENLLENLADVQRSVHRVRTSDTIELLQEFIGVVREFSRVAGRQGRGRGPVIDPATGALWIEEAESIIAALTT